jgi:23S rRNA pseudouridine1911/1915/1917 synthase
MNSKKINNKQPIYSNIENFNVKPKTFSHEFTVNEENKLLDFLLISLTNLSRNKIKSLLVHGNILVDGSIITKYDYPLKVNQLVQVSKELNPNYGLDKKLLDIIYEDDEIIVINKPEGLLSISTEDENEKTAYHLLSEYVKIRNKNNRVFVVHRLDKDTSGVFMIAKSVTVQKMLQDKWNDIVTKRSYIAIVEGTFKERIGTYESYLKETSTYMVYSSKVKGEGKKAITHYKVIDDNNKYSMLEVMIDSGRKNQIRVHMSENGHPLIGDKKSGAKSDPIKRLGLHAHVLEFTHPKTNKIMHFEAKIPSSFTNLFE